MFTDSPTPQNISEGKLLSDDRFLREVAHLYYDEGQTQENIAEAQYCSRQTISKALQRARDRGIVRISVIPEQRTGYLRNLARDLRLRLGLEDLILVPGRNMDEEQSSASDVLDDIAGTAADYLDQLLTDEDILAVSGGKDTMRQVVRYLKPTKLLPHLRIVPTIGFVRPQTSVGDANLTSFDIATAYGAKHNWLPIPAIVESQEQREQARALPIARDVLKIMEDANIIMTGLWPPFAQKAIFTQQKIEEITTYNPAVDINHWIFDNVGACINDRLESPPYYLTGLEIPRLKEKIQQSHARVILVAGANLKYIPAIRAALKAGIANILITDHVTAETLLKKPE
ncbi:sugar-binding transcriptional regulator [Ktedonobacter racemifer]|uniref:Transcriptional regulator, DeoR family n=1 Tax=Ktedonobacter racemifer DSM 44963 TaxID=485913 RepID=D6U8M9_KTERA|nr:sugar-binding domain-containing protein [Ktedonobacter racemifer]EFH80240.1 transcriptional regulator, DeoR family [Ktedonobacter racemifer DSM 44963]